MILKHCKGTTDKKKEAVCAWTSPKDEVYYEKKLGPDGYELGSGPNESTDRIAITRFYCNEEITK